MLFNCKHRSKQEDTVSGIIVAFAAVTIVVAASFMWHEFSENKRIGGKIVKVNYNFSKEFDN